MKKKIFTLVLTITTLIVNAQETDNANDHLKFKLICVFFDKKILGSKWSYGEDPNNPEKLIDFLVTLKIEGFNEETPIDFNYFSLVETNFKLRQRPHTVLFRHYELKKYNIENPEINDSFLKYTQSGIENYDHYYWIHNGFKKIIRTKQRFYILQIPKKENKKGEFSLHFPVKTTKSGEFSIYYKNNLIKTVSAKQGDFLKFE